MECHYIPQENRKVHDLAIATIYLEKDINIGGIIRTANAAAVKEVVIVGKRKVNWAGITSAKGGIEITKLRSLDEFLDYVEEKKYYLCALEISSDAKNIFDFKYPKNPIIVVGNEGRGLPRRLLDLSEIIKIPQYGNVECLNVATSLAIAIFDWIRKNAKLSERDIRGYKFTSKKEI